MYDIKTDPLTKEEIVYDTKYIVMLIMLLGLHLVC